LISYFKHISLWLLFFPFLFHFPFCTFLLSLKTCGFKGYPKISQRLWGSRLVLWSSRGRAKTGRLVFTYGELLSQLFFSRLVFQSEVGVTESDRGRQ
jgi:hypothetical protein